MADNIAGLNIDNTSLIIRADSYRDVTFTFASETTHVEGMLIAQVAATGKYAPFVDGGAGGLEVAVSALTADLTSTGAGDVSLRMLQDGELRADLLFALLDFPTLGVTDQIILQSLQDNSISTVFSDDRSQFDNAV